MDTTRSRSATSLATKELRFTNKIVVLNAITWMLIFSYFMIFIVKTSQGCSRNDLNDGVPLLSKLFTWLFNILGLVFLATGITMILTI